ncbi:uncharacterized protein LOC131881467 [Tigriopus californicus]|uniref:uncharacterized protein LOC131881467 n=1 Tax=Tigriopus californicus TaxID=6832 RepID=UPI0027DA5B7B|nr:uncharacterized protein LOC131881467 [Tigriopus californicus]
MSALGVKPRRLLVYCLLWSCLVVMVVFGDNEDVDEEQDLTSTTEEPPETTTILVEEEVVVEVGNTSRLEITELNRGLQTRLKVNHRNVTARLEDCQDVKLLQPDLYFGIKTDDSGPRKLPPLTNLTWSNDILRPILCATEFVVVYEVLGNTSETSSILCPSFDVIDNHNNLTCQANFTQDLCNQTLKFKLEAWIITGELFQPESEPVLIDCDPDFVTVFQNETDHLYQAMVQRQEQNSLVDVKDTDNGVEPIEEATSSDDDVDLFPLVLNPKKASCSWSSWSPWSKCPQRCGDTAGVRTRSRSQRGSRFCGKIEEETKPCYVNKCPQDCVFVTWSEWTSCSQTCGTGTKARTRSVGREAEFGGKPCIGKTTEKEPCSINNCAVDGMWSEWSTFGYCDRPCGNGTRVRTRSCTNPFPENGGTKCDGKSQEEEPCLIKECEPIDGQWSLWSRWSSCSTTCGKGKITRTRTCSRPEPEYGGQNCTGDNEQHRQCFLGICSQPVNPSTRPKVPSFDKRPSYINSRPFVDRYLVTGNGNKKYSLSLRNSILKRKPENVHPLLDENMMIDEAERCPRPPHYILGFQGPFITPGLDEEADMYFPEYNETIYYKCRHGKVTNPRTNQNIFRTHCIPSFGYVDLEKASCQWPSHCIGPPDLPEDNQDGVLSVPRRDAPLNSKAILVNKQDSSVLSIGYCFPDGKYRFESSEWNAPTFPSALTLSGCNGNGSGVLKLSDVDQFGWIHLDGNETHNCRLEGPIGYGFQIGLSDLADLDPPRVVDHFFGLQLEFGSSSNRLFPSHNISITINPNGISRLLLVLVTDP